MDADGTTVYLLVRVVSRPGVTAATLQVYPNSVRGAEYVRVPRAIVPLRVFDGTGELVCTQPAVAAGTGAVLPLAGLPAGRYLLRYGARSQRLTVD